MNENKTCRQNEEKSTRYQNVSKLTTFQQGLVDAARSVCRAKEHFDRSIERHGQASEISRSRYQETEAAFLTLVQRAVDMENK